MPITTFNAYIQLWIPFRMIENIASLLINEMITANLLCKFIIFLSMLLYVLWKNDDNKIVKSHQKWHRQLFNQMKLKCNGPKKYIAKFSLPWIINIIRIILYFTWNHWISFVYTHTQSTIFYCVYIWFIIQIFM